MGLQCADSCPRDNSETSVTTLAPAHRISLPAPLLETTRSALSSPFMTKLSLGDRGLKSRPTSPLSRSSSNPVNLDDIFSVQPVASTSTPRPGLSHTSASGEIERIRLQMREEGMAHFQETENRRPEYLRRTKRSLLDSDPTVDAALDLEERESVLPGVGITVSPMKGRRLKLFQETSEESFEESLMAGGYERYVSRKSSCRQYICLIGIVFGSAMRTGCSSLLQAALVRRFPLSKLNPCSVKKNCESGSGSLHLATVY